MHHENELMNVYHLNCGILHAPPNPQAACHCLLVEDNGRLILIDTGIGLHDIARPLERIGATAIDAAGFQFHESFTAIRQIERLGFHQSDVSDIILTHGDPDHAGGLSDFPQALVHVSEEEFTQLDRSHERYSSAQFAHRPHWVIHTPSAAALSSSNSCVKATPAPRQWFGLEARPVLLSCDIEILLIPLFGHTAGHCGVAVRTANRWLLHVGDAYYLRAELSTDDHPVSVLAAQRAENDALRRTSLQSLRRLASEHLHEMDLFGYHDLTEFPEEPPFRADTR